MKKSHNTERVIPASAQATLVTITVFLAYMGQMLLNPIIAPLSREMGLREWHIGAAISLAAIVLASLSTYWGRASQKLGAKRVLVIGMTIAVVALTSFAVLSYFGLHHKLMGPALVIGVLVTRGILYGGGISAVAPTTQAHLVTHTDTEAGRVKALGLIGAAQGMASIIGGIVGGALAAIGGLLLPLTIMPIIMIVGIIVLAAKFKPQAATALIETPKRISFKDPRILPWLVTGLLMFLVFSSIATIFGFTVQDRFNLNASTTAGVTAIYLTVMGVAMILGQGLIAPKLGWGAAKLLRRGLVIVLAGTVCLWPIHSYALLAVAALLIGVGLGLAMPGYNSGPTLQMDNDEQGSVAGLINANNGVAYAIAPIASTALYGWHPVVPFAVCIALIAFTCVFAFLHPLLKK